MKFSPLRNIALTATLGMSAIGGFAQTSNCNDKVGQEWMQCIMQERTFQNAVAQQQERQQALQQQRKAEDAPDPQCVGSTSGKYWVPTSGGYCIWVRPSQQQTAQQQAFEQQQPAEQNAANVQTLQQQQLELQRKQFEYQQQLQQQQFEQQKRLQYMEAWQRFYDRQRPAPFVYNPAAVAAPMTNNNNINCTSYAIGNTVHTECH